MPFYIKIVMYYCCLLFIIIEKLAECSEPCAYFEFQNLPDKVITVKEKTTVNIDFSLRYEECSSSQTIIQISAWNVVQRTYSPRCNILQKTDDCGGAAYPSMSCTCNNTTNGLYSFMKIVDRSDNKQWRWSTLDKKAKETIITFNVIYPAQITSLCMDGLDISGLHSVVVNQSVTLTCTWENGNPPTTVRLLDSYKRVLVNSNNTNITYSYSSAHCDLSGLIRCEAQQSFKLVQLYVHCPPTFMNLSSDFHHATYGQDVYLHFKFRANNLNTSGCNLTHMDHDGSYQCNLIHGMKVTDAITNQTTTNANLVSHEPGMKCSYSVSGTVPVLTLSVRLLHVTDSDGGKWTVTLSNMNGTGAHTFDLEILWSPAKVIDMAVNGHQDQRVYLVSRNDSVHIVCIWKKGYQHSTARLFNNRGNVLQSQIDGLDILYTFQSIDCRDAGVLRCDADNASQNMSATLLVKCPPEFKNTSQYNITMSDSSYAAISIPFRAHTSLIKQCQLAKFPEQYEHVVPYYTVYICNLSKMNHADSKQYGPNANKCMCSVHGVEPFLILTIALYDVTNHDNGKWRATLENEIGNDCAYFFLIANKDSTLTWNIMPIIAVLPLTIVVAIAIVLSVLYWRTVQNRANCKCDIQTCQTPSAILRISRQNQTLSEDILPDMKSVELNTVMPDQSVLSSYSDEVITVNRTTLTSQTAEYLTPSFTTVIKTKTTALADSSEISRIPSPAFDGYLNPRAEILTTTEELYRDTNSTNLFCERPNNGNSPDEKQIHHGECDCSRNGAKEKDVQLLEVKLAFKMTPSEEYTGNSHYETIE